VVADTNLASKKPTRQCSTYSNYSLASLAVDGQGDTRSCTVYDHVHPWWSVDLRATYDVGRVTVTNDQQEEHGIITA